MSIQQLHKDEIESSKEDNSDSELSDHKYWYTEFIYEDKNKEVPITAVEFPEIDVAEQPEQMAKLQRESDDLKPVIDYLESGDLPDDSKSARRIILDADQWFLDDNKVLYHIYQPRLKNKHKLTEVMLQLATP